MSDERAFLQAIEARPRDDLRRLVFADWLDERNDPRADFIRLHLALALLGPDHLDRVAGEHELSVLRKQCDAAFLKVIEPKRASHRDDPTGTRRCTCFNQYSGQRKQLRKTYFHTDTQDTECYAWKLLLAKIGEAAHDGVEEFAPFRRQSEDVRSQIITLPPSIATLKTVKTLDLYGSSLVRLPPEIGEMTSLETFVPYTSYRLHWFPFELTRCPRLRSSTVSTRAIYGNYKHRPPFPQLDLGASIAPGRKEPERLHLKHGSGPSTRPCSVCGTPFEDRRRHRVWISLRVATDVLPLLVNACSDECVCRLPTPPEGYVQTPHQGGDGVEQPPPE